MDARRPRIRKTSREQFPAIGNRTGAPPDTTGDRLAARKQPSLASDDV